MRPPNGEAILEGMTVLVAWASKHGATAEIATALARDLCAHGLDVDVRSAEEVDGVAHYDAVVLGSAIYMGRWMPAALAVAQLYADELATRPTWLFSSGPIGDPPAPSAPDFRVLEQQVDARGHRVFPGRLSRTGLSLAERGIVHMTHAPYGDFRDWDEVSGYADEIASSLVAATP